MKKLLFLLFLSLPTYADKAIWLPDGRSCTQNSFGQVFGCSDNFADSDDGYRPQPRKQKRQYYNDSGSRFGKTGTLDRRKRYEYNINIYDDYDD